jgi:hypothetical protein
MKIEQSRPYYAESGMVYQNFNHTTGLSTIDNGGLKMKLVNEKVGNMQVLVSSSASLFFDYQKKINLILFSRMKNGFSTKTVFCTKTVLVRKPSNSLKTIKTEKVNKIDFFCGKFKLKSPN